MDYETIRAELVGTVGRISLNQPARLNALTARMSGEIADALDSLPQKGARAILLRAEGKGFCSGADLTDREGMDPRDIGSRLEAYFNPMLLKIAACPLPIVAAVQGACAGIGVPLALSADFVIAGRFAYFLQAFVNIGLVPDGGASWLLPRLIGRARATQLMMLGERLPAETAEQWGMIYKAVDDVALEDHAHDLAQRLAAGPTRALGLIRQDMAAALDSGYESALQRERQSQRVAGGTTDFQEGVQAFLAKRPAKFTGG